MCRCVAFVRRASSPLLQIYMADESRTKFSPGPLSTDVGGPDSAGHGAVDVVAPRHRDGCGLWSPAPVSRCCPDLRSSRSRRHFRGDRVAASMSRSKSTPSVPVSCPHPARHRDFRYRRREQVTVVADSDPRVHEVATAAGLDLVVARIPRGQVLSGRCDGVIAGTPQTASDPAPARRSGRFTAPRPTMTSLPGSADDQVVAVGSADDGGGIPVAGRGVRRS